MPLLGWWGGGGGVVLPVTYDAHFRTRTRDDVCENVLEVL